MNTNTIKKSYNCIINNAMQIVQIVSNGERFIRGNSDQLKNLSIINKTKETDNLCIVSIE
jgi:hypothetical protein